MAGARAPNVVRRLAYRSGLVRAPERYREWLELDLATQGIARRLALVHVLVGFLIGLTVLAVAGLVTGLWTMMPPYVVVTAMWGVVNVGFLPRLLLERRMRSLVRRNGLFH